MQFWLGFQFQQVFLWILAGRFENMMWKNRGPAENWVRRYTLTDTVLKQHGWAADKQAEKPWRDRTYTGSRIQENRLKHDCVKLRVSSPGFIPQGWSSKTSSMQLLALWLPARLWCSQHTSRKLGWSGLQSPEPPLLVIAPNTVVFICNPSAAAGTDADSWKALL